MKKTVDQIAKQYGVSPTAVRQWIKSGLKTTIEKVIGIKPRMVIDPADVDEFLNVGERRK